jgi:Family of unknown function (DUF6192)
MIRWSDIEAECGDYREGFVAIFRKYEGQPTDEKDGQGRTVAVTAASFARHMGIAEGTFKDWVKPRARPGRDHSGAARRFARNLSPAEKTKLATDLIGDPDVVDELARNRPARQAIRRAADEASLANVPDPGYRREPSGAGGLGGVADELEVQGLIRKARLAVRDAIELAGPATFDEAAQSLIVDDINRVRAGLDHLESAVASTDVDIDAALADLLDGTEG